MRIGINQFCFPAPCDVSEALHRAKGLGYDCMEICLTADRRPGPAVGGVTDALDISGVVLTKLDGDARGGAALSIRAVTGKPIKFVGTGEKLEMIEPFHPDRMASRILGMGDMLSFIEKAEAAFDQKQAAKLEEKLRKNRFTLQDYYDQLLHEHAGEAEFLQLRRMAEEVGIPLCSVGGIISFSIYPLTAREPEVVQTSMDAVRRMLDAAQVLGAASALVIPGVATEDMAYEEAYTTAQERVSELADYAPSVGLMIENVWNNMLYSPLELARFVDEMGRKNVGICFDIANARRFGYPEQWIRTLGKRILEFHCKDYRMSVDNINGFTNLLDGDVNYPAVMAAIRDIGFDGDLIVELCQMNGRKG